MIPTSASSSANAVQSEYSAMMGIASLVLEGRAISDDDFVLSEQTVSSPGVQYYQRLQEKLGQLRQSSPGTSRDQSMLPGEQELTVGSNGSLDKDLLLLAGLEDEPEPFWLMHRPHPMLSLQSLASTSLRLTPRSTLLRPHRDSILSTSSGSSSSSISSTPSTRIENSHGSSSFASSSVQLKSKPKQGPHCEQFLKKLGISKGVDSHSESEEHICDTSVVNEICYHWRIHCLEIDTITSKSEPICIEVYIGPESHAILLEQWIIEPTEKPQVPQMTLSSLCTAIRSQLYFSQITAWCDLIRKSDNREMYKSGRFKFPSGTAAATSTPTTIRSAQKNKPRLDIFYRIKSYDYSTCCSFRTKPVVHNFPTVIINDTCALSVSLKSLPRIHNIPAISPLDINSTLPILPMTVASSTTTTTPSDQTCTTSLPASTQRKPATAKQCKEKGKHKCVLMDEDDDEEENGLSHREKQVLKYKRLMKKRDTKRSIVRPSAAGSGQQLPEFGSINSIRPPLYQINLNSITESVQTNCVEMISIGTQTTSSTDHISCDHCGNHMSIICLNCDSIASGDISSAPTPPPAPVIDQAEMLLQAIQRTPRKKSPRERPIVVRWTNEVSSPVVGGGGGGAGGGNQSFISNGDGNKQKKKNQKSLGKSDCTLCKRQKTQHTYHQPAKPLHVEYNNNNTIHFLGECIIDECGGCGSTINKEQEMSTDVEDPHLSPSTQFKTPTTTRPQTSQMKLSLFKLPGQRRFDMKSVESAKPSNHITKIIPKVNLTQIFCNPLADLNSTTAITTTTTPITIEPTDGYADIPVQKSNSAPTLPSASSPCLSPRFAKQAAIYQRRSRHLSDRSDRSSLGSDEQISDDDFDPFSFGFYSPNAAASPFKNRIFLKSSVPGGSTCFGRKALLGNLEESLIQRRFMPKKLVSGFKILLGAAGAFCPTQLTIPAASYFYELHGNSMNTPYVCEIRMPRKGYRVPSSGNIQATLLNPEGTVVKMFVIPYDLHDMPPMNQTFIRQRILAVNDEKDNPKLNQNLNSLKYLRYSIHLRFQTSRSGRLMLHTDIRILISRRTDCDTAAAHAKGDLESPKELKIHTIMPEDPKYSQRQESPSKI